MMATGLEESSHEVDECVVQPKMVSLKHVKGVASKLGPRHPLRVLLATEPDELSLDEFMTKSEIWWALLRMMED